MSSIRLLRVLHLRQLRRQPVRAVLTLVSLGAGVSISVAALVLLSSVRHSDRELLRALAGPAPLRVVGPLIQGGLDQSVVARVSAVPGVDHVVPMVQASTIAERKDGRQLRIVAIGVDCRIEAFVGDFGCSHQTLRAPRRDAPILISSVLAHELGAGGVGERTSDVYASTASPVTIRSTTRTAEASRYFRSPQHSGCSHERTGSTTCISIPIAAFPSTCSSAESEQ